MYIVCANECAFTYNNCDRNNFIYKHSATVLQNITSSFDIIPDKVNGLVFCLTVCDLVAKNFNLGHKFKAIKDRDFMVAMHALDLLV